jgi:hypothetical protein
MVQKPALLSTGRKSQSCPAAPELVDEIRGAMVKVALLPVPAWVRTLFGLTGLELDSTLNVSDPARFAEVMR